MTARIYSASILAIKNRADEFGREHSLLMHIPALIPASTIDEAAEICRRTAFDRWPVDHGWGGHQVLIQPVTAAFCDAYKVAKAAGAIGVDDEAPECFRFDPAAPTPDNSEWNLVQVDDDPHFFDNETEIVEKIEG